MAPTGGGTKLWYNGGITQRYGTLKCHMLASIWTGWVPWLPARGAVSAILEARPETPFLGNLGRTFVSGKATF